jgi:hypothetical protein
MGVGDIEVVNISIALKKYDRKEEPFGSVFDLVPLCIN